MTKPPYTYASLAAQAIWDTPGRRLSLLGIYEWIVARYQFYKDNTAAWQNSIRHNLSLKGLFIKTARMENEEGKGSLWMINPEMEHEFDGMK
ncbi:fork head transcription factor, partial [Atractiella rhizophila]